MKALVVEDSKTQGAELREILEAAAVDVEVAPHAEAALEYLGTNPHPSVILTEDVLPGLSGFELCRRIKAELNIPVVIMTSLLEPTAVLRAMAAGADDYLAKPYRKEVVFERLQRAVSKGDALPLSVDGELIAHTAMPRQYANVLLSSLEDAAHRYREAEEHRRQLLEAKAQREEFMRVVAHEVRSPLNVLMLAAQLAAGGKSDRLDSLPSLVTREGRRMARLISDLSDLSRIDMGTMTIDPVTLRLDDLVRGSVERIEQAAPQVRIDLKLGFEATVFADSERTEQVVVNLVQNAIKYSPQGAPIQVRCVHDGALARVEIQDRGEGIPREDQERIFERYVRLGHAANPEGAGIGLYVSKKLIEAQGGAIGVNSEPGHGATFWFTLPLAQAAG